MVSTPIKSNKSDLTKEQRDQVRTAIRNLRAQLKEIGLQESEALY